MSADQWVRYRFRTDSMDDPRPVKWPPPGPFWESGFTDTYVVLIAWFPAGADLYEFWPEATEVEAQESGPPTYTDRFPKPEWMDR